ncbi:MAG: glycosyltransferase family 39 protein [Gomphosphaeria aponina SAG 52.96 = DSM 107014]|uniref:Glycosyltransferase family 39 protein n=1 Tax=Gomphosphaeria aponina SAG 52.96 = DSM 107014 TaxID=1521640 RepID=A0A941JNL6_9CHRO|nr:glycosyltransferase family 39 protein [Gomphosphaeria aponina SAG 52.96 = DSM 107014]
MVKKKKRHYLILAGIIILGVALRFGQLDLKPLGIDEIATALFSLGKGYEDVPLNVATSLSSLQEVFTLRKTTWPEIAWAVSTESTHPPLFFCLLHQWLVWLQPVSESLVWKLRAFPALWGVAAIAAVYCLNRLAFSPTAGLMGAAVMAVSPFGVYLSQEARHYTLPVFLITLALLALIQIEKDMEKSQISVWWLIWLGVNTISFYVHYFCILAFVAQVLILIILSYNDQGKNLGKIILLALTSFALFLPWLTIVMEHFNSPKTSWLSGPENLAPLYQLPMAWLLMAIALPVENQPLAIQIIAGCLMIGFGGWVAWHTYLGLLSQTKSATFIISLFILFVLLEFLLIIYILHKDITIAPRYNFIYFPAFCALLGAGIVNRIKFSVKLPIMLILVGTISSLFVVFDLAFKKPYHPQAVVNNFKQDSGSLMIVVGYEDTINIALGLSYAKAMEPEGEKNQGTYLAFVDSSAGYDLVWEKVATMSVLPENLWVVAPGLKQKDYPAQLHLAQSNCQLEPEQYYRIGIPYQLYQCQTKIQ